MYKLKENKLKNIVLTIGGNKMGSTVLVLIGNCRWIGIGKDLTIIIHK